MGRSAKKTTSSTTHSTKKTSSAREAKWPLRIAIGPKTPQISVNKAIATKKRAKKDAMVLCTVPEMSAPSLGYQQCEEDTLLASEEPGDILNSGTSVVVMSASQTESQGFQMAVDEGYPKLNPPSHYRIIAKSILSCRQTHSQQVTGGTHCIVQAQSGLHEFVTWAQIQQKQIQREASFQDDDYGHGLHARVDRDFLAECRGQNTLNVLTDYQVVDAIMYRSKHKTVYYITVFLRLKDKGKAEKLYQKRKEAGYDYSGPIRSSSSGFLAAGGSRKDFDPILQERQPEMYREYLESTRRRRFRKMPPMCPEGRMWQLLEKIENLFSDLNGFETIQAAWIQALLAQGVKNETFIALIEPTLSLSRLSAAPQDSACELGEKKGRNQATNMTRTKCVAIKFYLIAKKE
ncbi:hypothetical protein IQ07DRAFT_669137 [Pyrenochaeta sp. DS3sAY3a]|nr:hypothetical protein IQ07DRAFT_669137 [Pyrenochaeta sp. DS3sAY3a]